jgi:hypothetical protein
MVMRNDPERVRIAGPEEAEETGADEDLEEAAELLPQQEPPLPEDPPEPDLDPLLTDPAD